MSDTTLTAANITPMTTDELLSAIRDEVAWSAEDHDARQKHWDEAIDYFYGKRPFPPSAEDQAEGFSTIVSTDVADAVEAVAAEIMPAFSGQAPVEFQALGPEDEQAATEETQAVTHVAANCGAYMAINYAVKDALLRRAGIVKVYWERKATVCYETHNEVPFSFLPQALSDKPGETVEVVEGEIDEIRQTASGTVRRYKICSKPRLDAVPLDEFLISANTATPNLDEARFRAHQRPMPRTELIELGIDPDIVYSIDSYDTADTRKAGARARTSQDRELRTGHISTEYVMVCESYYNVDFDGDGIAELRRIVTAGGRSGDDELLINEPWDEQPFALGVPYLGIFSWDGISLHDKLKSVQDTKTEIIRELINATKRNMRQRLGILERDANPRDAQNSRMGGYIRCKTPNGVFPIPDVQVPPQAYSTLEYMDTVRKDKGGGAIDTAAQVNALAGDTAHGLERMMSAAEQVNAMVAKNLCETMIKAIYRKLHKLLRQYMRDPIRLPGSAGWLEACPDKWRPRESMTISMGMSVGERTRRTATLQAIIMQQEKDAESDRSGILVDFESMYQARIDLARMGGLPNPEQYSVNPASPEAQQVIASARQKAQQQVLEAQQREQQTMQYQYSLMTDIERVRNEGKLQQQAMENAFGELKLYIDSIVKMFGERVELAKVKQEADSEEERADVERLQVVASRTPE